MKKILLTILLLFINCSFISAHSYTINDIKIIVKRNCKKYNLDYHLMLSLMEHESLRAVNYDLQKAMVVRSRSGAVGLFQIMPIHARMRNLPISALENPEKNIGIGCAYFAQQIKIAKKRRYRHIIAEALRQYNQGPGRGNGIKHRDRYKNWKRYVYSIIRHANKLKTTKTICYNEG